MKKKKSLIIYYSQIIQVKTTSIISFKKPSLEILRSFTITLSNKESFFHNLSKPVFFTNFLAKSRQRLNKNLIHKKRN